MTSQTGGSGYSIQFLNTSSRGDIAKHIGDICISQGLQHGTMPSGTDKWENGNYLVYLSDDYSEDNIYMLVILVNSPS